MSEAVRSVSRDAVIAEPTSIGERLSDSVRDRSFAMIVFILFAGTAGIVVTAGLVAVVLFTISSRRQEIAVRLAIGARPLDILRVVLGEAVFASALGLIAGALAARLGAEMIRHLVYGIQPGDFLASLGTASVLMIVIVLSAFIAARPALRIAPAAALRAE